MDEVFISYSRRDSVFAHRLKEALEITGHTTWIDCDDIEPGEDWQKRIYAGIDAAEVVVFISSPDSLKSKACHTELARALVQSKLVIPVMRRESKDEELESAWAHQEWKDTAHANCQWLKKSNWINCRKKLGFDCQYDEVTRAVTNPDCDSEESDAEPFKAAVESLLRVIAISPERRREHAVLLDIAERWKANKGDEDLLLRGDQLRHAAHWLEFAADTEPVLTNVQREFIKASLCADRRARRRRRLIAVALAGLLIGLVASAVIAYLIEQERAETARLEKITRSINVHTSGTNSYRLGDFAIAQANYAEALHILDDNPDLADHPLFDELEIDLRNWPLDLAVACLQVEDFTCARQTLAEAQQQDSDNYLIYLNLALLYRDQQPPDYKMVGTSLEQARASAPDNFLIEYLCERIEISVAFQREEWQGVIDYYLNSETAQFDWENSGLDTVQISIFSPYQLEILYYVASSYEELGKEEEACPYWWAYAHLSVQFPPTYRTLGDSVRAEDAARRIFTSSCEL